jgi:tetratricopeptide (TPR) repeat protein
LYDPEEDSLEELNDEAEAAFAEGLRWLAQREYSQALPLFARAFQLQNSPRYECYFAWTLFLSQPQNQLQAKIALMHLEKSRKAEPYYEKTYLFLGHIFQQMRRFDEALQIYREALAFSPAFLEVYRELRLLELQVTRAFKT